ncbi:hypothetical protein [Lonepinella sp. BR2357]|uniref:hypothetical protein n=1 Tax=Lonepinella sp. BR2357 TaxID=3434549 RepID=UPI003F6DDC48
MPKQADFLTAVNQFIADGKALDHRYHSFDFCYAHFHPSNPARENVEIGCFVLWSYLASWGMLRGSSFLLQKNPAYLTETVRYILAQDPTLWAMNIEPENFDTILKLYDDIEKCIIEKNERSLVLVTKILLGVFGIVPAYDENFTQTFKSFSANYHPDKKECGFTSVNKHSLAVIHQFHLAHQHEIEQIQAQHKIIDFRGKPTPLIYSAAKIIDMYGFTKGLKN